jgi:hypothetical protein
MSPRRRVALAALAIAVTAAGCGADTEGPAAPTTVARAGRPATDAQLLMLAQVLDRNRKRGGARFTARLDVHGRKAVATGRVDFRSGRGTAVLRGAEPGGGRPRRFYWTRHAVLAQTAPGTARYTLQPPDPEGDPVHAMVGFVNLLAAETIDNTTNLRHQQARLVGHTTIADVPIEIYSYGRTASTTLWVQRRGGLLRRVHTDRVPGGLTVDLQTHEPVTIALPRHDDA